MSSPSSASTPGPAPSASPRTRGWCRGRASRGFRRETGYASKSGRTVPGTCVSRLAARFSLRVEGVSRPSQDHLLAREARELRIIIDRSPRVFDLLTTRNQVLVVAEPVAPGICKVHKSDDLRQL